jgi:hypothetical protein
MDTVTQLTDDIALELSSGITIHLVCENGSVRGIGRVHLGDLELRRGDILLAPVFQSEAGIAYRELRLVGIDAQETRTVVHLAAIGTPGELQETVDVFRIPQVVLPQPYEEQIADPLQLILEPVTQEIDGVLYRGFSYQFTLTSSTQQFTTLLERGTWELDRLERPLYTVAQRTGSTPFEVRVTEETAFDTSERFTNHGTDVLCWQMMTRYAGAPAFDFQFNDRASLLMYYDRPSYVTALQQSAAGERSIAHLDRHRFALSAEATHPKKYVLANLASEGLTLTEGRNRWSAAFDVVVPHLRAYYGYQQDVMDPCYSAPLWDSWLLRDPQSPRKILDWIPKLDAYGVKTLLLAPLWVCDTSLDVGGHEIAKTFGQGNICLPWRYEIAPEFGGEALLKEICDAAHAHGIKVLIWIGAWVDIDAPLYKEHPEWAVRTPAGEPFSGDYLGFSVMSYNTPFKAWLLEQILGVKARVGLDGFFLDSYHNLQFQPISYADPLRAPQMDALIDYQVQLQQAGSKLLIETQGIFGISLNWFHPSALPFRRKGGLELLRGQEYTLKNMQPCVNNKWLSEGMIPEDFLYRATACGSPLRIEMDHQYPEPIEFPDGIFAGMLERVNHEYNRVCPYMQKRCLLEDDQGVEWTNSTDATKVLFAFADFAYPATGKVDDVTSGRTFTCEGSLQAEQFHTYILHA